MATPRKPFQGVVNILRFNWHFYVLAVGGISASLTIGYLLGDAYLQIGMGISVLIGWVSIFSLFISYLIYDVSPLYELKFTRYLRNQHPGMIVNIHAGFDETSELLQSKFPGSTLRVFDFYDPEKHTEVSIKRARKAYPPFPGTRSVNTSHIPVENFSADQVYLIFAAHEIRDDEERIHFLEEVCRIAAPDAQIILTEHLRDLPNFVAYTLGFFHFMPRKTWESNFRSAKLTCVKELKATPFVTTFILEKNGTST